MLINSAKPIELKDKSQDKVKRVNKRTGDKYETHPSFSPKKWLNNTFIVHYVADSKRVPRSLEHISSLTADEVSNIQDSMNSEFKRLGWDMKLDLIPNVTFKAITSGIFEPTVYEYQDDEGNTHYGLCVQYEYKETPKPLGITIGASKA